MRICCEWGGSECCMEETMRNNRICRVCGRQYEFADGYEWLQAVPDGLNGQALRDNVQWWCSRECHDNDPQHHPLPDGEALLDMINRLKADAGPIPGDIGELFVRASSLTREEIVRAADEIVRELAEGVSNRLYRK